MANRSDKSASNVEDMWTKLSREKKSSPASSSGAVTAANAENDNGANSNVGITVNQNLIFIGDAGCGKTSLIQTFLKPNAAKDSKPTLALDYNYARKTTNNVKSVAHFWEVGGNFLESGFLEIPITTLSLKNSAIAIVCDLSKPHNCIVSVLRCISAVREILSKRMSELQANNVNQVNEIKDNIANQFKGHKDGNRVRPTDLPLIIIANKHDTIRSMSLAERKALFQGLRFIAHYFGAIFMSVSINDATTRECFRSLMNSLGFNAPIKPMYELNVDKLVCISRGQDSYENILIQGIQEMANSAETGSKIKYRMIASETEIDQYLTGKGVTRDCWNKLTDHMAAIFGEADPLPSYSLSTKGEQSGGMESGDADNANPGDENPFPEPEIDQTRVERMLALQRYIQEMERKQEMMAKLNAASAKDK